MIGFTGFGFRKRPTAVALAVRDPHWPAKLVALRQQLAVTPSDHPLVLGFLGLLERNVITELETMAVPGLSSEELHRFAGRIGILLDVKREFEKLHREAVAQKQV